MSRPGFMWWKIWVIVVIFWGCSSSRQSRDTYQEKLPNTVLWEISSRDLDSPSYLLGTIHLIPEDQFFWPEHFQNAYNAVDQVVLEVSELGMDPATLMELMPKIMLPDGQSLEDLVTEKEYSQIEGFFSEMGLPVMFFKNIKPFFLYMLVDIDMSALMQDNIKSYELEITQKANGDQKPISGLETLDFQVSIFDSIPYEDQADMLVSAIAGKSKNKSESEEAEKSDELYQTYVNQDLNAILQQVKETDPSLMKFYKLLLEDRNVAWIPKIEEFIRQKASLVAVGAAHLPGEMGVIHLLKKAGYTLKPVMGTSDGTH